MGTSQNVVKIAPGRVLASLTACQLVAESRLDASLPHEPKATIVTDSRKLEKGCIFIAYRGASHDGHAHLATAGANQASLVIGDDLAKLKATANLGNWICVHDARAAWAQLCAEAFDHPQRRMRMVGVTGTNGKTSTVWLTRHLLRLAGVKTLAIGTLGTWLGDEFIPTTHTTPDPPVFYGLLAKALAANIDVCVMEVSSHAIVQSKVVPVRFHATAMTSFSRDHLDLHGSMDEYLAAKLRLFRELATNSGRQAFAASLKDLGAPPNPTVKDLWRYGFAEEFTRHPWPDKGWQKLEIAITGYAEGRTRLTLIKPSSSETGEVSLLGDYSVANFACALLLAEAVASSVPASRWREIPPVPGRLEPVVGAASKPQVIVDYAHTPDALQQALRVLRPLCQGQLWVVFGCGGNRDQGKRPLMGAVAREHADRVVVTSDNPRDEDPRAIIADVIGKQTDDELVIEPDREKAIAWAIAKASASDIVLIAGKGHEDYMEIAGRRHTFDDRVVARRYLEA